MTPEISELVRELEEFQANEPGFPQIFTRAAAALRHFSELIAVVQGDLDRESKEAESYHAFWIEERSKRLAAVKALKSASTQCDNVIYNCNQRPADNQRHLDSWCSVKAFIDTAIRNDHVSSPVTEKTDG